VLYRRALGVCEKSLGREHPCAAALLCNLAGIQRERHQYGEAERLYRRAIAIEETTLGPEHSEVFKTLSNLARTYYLDERYKDAEPLFVRALKIAELSLDPGHPDVVSTLSNYVALLRKLHRKTEATRIAAEVRERHARSDRENPGRFEVDWRDLQQKGR
jgi:tetratricopeptide (TPR) repeat protein